MRWAGVATGAAVVRAAVGAPVSATVPQAWHSPQRPTHFAVVHPHSPQRKPGVRRVVVLVAMARPYGAGATSLRGAGRTAVRK